MKTRIISGLIGLAILLVVLYSGGMVFKGTILAITLVGLYEYHRAIEGLKDKYIVSYMNYLFAIALFFKDILGMEDYLGEILFLYAIAVAMHMVLKRDTTLKDVSYSLFGGIYVAFFLSHLYSFEGSMLIWLIFIVAWMTDTFAYFTGMFFGKHKLCPHLSPKKTVEGALGGVVGAAVSAVVFSLYFKVNGVFLIGIMAVFGSVISQIGDLTASRIKRIAGIKDYGNLMPGHGGVLDRFDSIIFASPFIYYSLKLFGLM